MRTDLQFNKIAHGTKRRDERIPCLPRASHSDSIPSSILPSRLSACIKLVIKFRIYVFPPLLIQILSSHDSWHFYPIPECFSSNIIFYVTIFLRLCVFNFIFIFLNFDLLSLCLEEWPHSLFLIVRIYENIFLLKRINCKYLAYLGKISEKIFS